MPAGSDSRNCISFGAGWAGERRSPIASYRSPTRTKAALERLRLFAGTNDGFALAEADLLARGTGQLFGERQSGLGDLHVASLLRDRSLLEEARVEAQQVLAGWYAVEGTGARASSAAGSIAVLLEAAEERFGRKISWLDRV